MMKSGEERTHRSKYFSAKCASANMVDYVNDIDRSTKCDKRTKRSKSTSHPYNSTTTTKTTQKRTDACSRTTTSTTGKQQTVLTRRKFAIDDYSKPTTELAKYLLGKRLVHQQDNGETLVGRVVETEAYPGVVDEASHSYGGKRTERTKAMFKDAGWLYVYSIYGMYVCLNVTSSDEGGAVLIRALQPVQGGDTMLKNRESRRRETARALKPHELCNGPAKLCQAMNIDRTLNQTDMKTSGQLYMVEDEDVCHDDIVVCTRIGIGGYGEKASGKLYRYYVRGNPHVSVKDKLVDK